MKKLTTFLVLGAGCLFLASCDNEESASKEPTVTYRKMTDAISVVLRSDRTAYTKNIVARLKKEGVMPSEHWKDEKQKTLLPAQMFRAGQEIAMSRDPGFFYQLKSIWPINPKNLPNEFEKAGFEKVAESGGAENFYGQEEIDGQKYFVAIYPDVAVSPACVDCHNEHKDSPRKDFKMDEVMGGIVIRVPME
ncbi:MAG: DUF3365 domain-containing protein [Lentisphaeria bacterium]|nr:DUF3365 domain-containing protein [Lentisphaeria bacterium]